MPRSKFEFGQVNDAEFASQLELNQVKDNAAVPSVFDAEKMNNYLLWQRLGGDGNSIFTLPISTKTSNYTVMATDYTLLVDATSNAVTITLPTAVGIAGRVYIVKRIDNSSYAVTVDPNGSETIDGDTTVELGQKWSSVSLQSDGTNWMIVGRN